MGLESANNKLPKLEPNKANYVDPLNSFVDDLDARLQTDFITGLRLAWVSGTAISVGTGAAWVSGKGRLKVTAAITKSGLSLSASAWYHVYLYYDAGTLAAAAEVVTTAPANYFGTAYQKAGDATRRYLGSVRTNASGQILNFIHYPQPGYVRYRVNLFAAPLRVLSGGVATAETAVDCSGAVPATGRLADVRLLSTDPAAAIIAGTPDDGADLAAGEALAAAGAAPYPMPLDAAQTFTYRMNAAPTSGAGYADVLGYYFER